MPEYLAPGVYIEELPGQSHPIQGVATSTVGFIGVAQQASAAEVITSFTEFERAMGDSVSGNLPIAVRGFFQNGGTRCYVARIAPADALQAGLDALATEDISILCCPDEHRFPNGAAVMAAHCEQRQDRVCILQSPQPVMPAASHNVPVHSSYATYYYPWLTVVGLDGVSSVTAPPGGHVAGIYAQVDSQRGVWTAPAGVPLVGVTGLSQQISAAESSTLSARGINLVRFFPGQGNRVWGAHDQPGAELEVRERPPAGSVHRTVPQPGSAMGCIRAEWAGALGNRAHDHRGFPAKSLEVRRTDGNKTGGGVLRPLRQHGDDANRH